MVKRFVLLNAGLLAMLFAQAAREPIFTPVKIDGPAHDPAKQTYWFGPFSECASVLDVDGDGDLDIAAGRNWYEAPDWIKHENFRDGAETNGPETDDNSEFAMDVNRDGRMDIVSSGWMRMKGAFWYENPGQPGVKWKAYRIHSAESMEGVIHGDIDGDGDEDVLVNHWSLQPRQGMTWIEHIGREPWFVEHLIGAEGERHGNGLADVNGDGRIDIITPDGWYEGPPRPASDKWSFHPDWKFKGAASHPMVGYDVSGDGKTDIIIGSAHAYGLFWYEQKTVGGKRTFVEHALEESFGGFHTMAFGDLDGDGKRELVTGKRLFPHHGGDIGEFDPLFVFYYKLGGGAFDRRVLSFNHMQWHPGEKTFTPPPNAAIGVGMKINVADMDRDGRQDVVLAGKSGLYILYNRGNPPTRRPKDLLPPEDTYASWFQWPRPEAQRKHWVTLFDGKDLAGWRPGAKNWTVEDGAIALKNSTDGKEHNDNYLWTAEQYGDFALDLEYRVPVERANSGVFLRTSDPNDPVQTGIEIQVGNAPPKSRVGRGTVGGIYDLAAPVKILHRPGEWNRYVILCRGSRIIVYLNGELTSEADLSKWTTARLNPDGSRNKFTRPLNDFARRGYIGLQDHGSPVWYRNIRIRPLD